MTIKRKQLWQLIIGGLLLLALAGTIWFIFSNSMQPARVSSNSSQRVLRTLQELLRRLGQSRRCRQPDRTRRPQGGALL